MSDNIGMPPNTQYIFRAITDEGACVMSEEGFSDDYSTALERFQCIAIDVNSRVVRITADLALDPNWVKG